MDTRDIRTELVTALERRGKVRRSGKTLEFCCPQHDDTNPSAWLGEHHWGCHACGFDEPLDSLCDHLGVERPTWGFTLEQYAELKRFDIPKLQKWGVETATIGNGGQVVAFAYRDAEGKTLRRKFRRLTGDTLTWWEGKSLPTHLYGLDMLAKTPATMPVILVEGESDCHAAWHHKRLAIGVPGANGWKSKWSPLFKDRETYVWQEPGAAGEKFVADICQDLPEAKVIQANGTKDLADLHKEAGKDFSTKFDEMMAN